MKVIACAMGGATSVLIVAGFVSHSLVVSGAKEDLARGGGFSVESRVWDTSAVSRPDWLLESAALTPSRTVAVQLDCAQETMQAWTRVSRGGDLAGAESAKPVAMVQLSGKKVFSIRGAVPAGGPVAASLDAAGKLPLYSLQHCKESAPGARLSGVSLLEEAIGQPVAGKSIAPKAVQLGGHRLSFEAGITPGNSSERTSGRIESWTARVPAQDFAQGEAIFRELAALMQGQGLVPDYRLDDHQPAQGVTQRYWRYASGNSKAPKVSYGLKLHSPEPLGPQGYPAVVSLEITL